ncbi:NLR family CARD domain-containing protein 3-like [Sardina pilchardus]|uniref:NLR family CARD domain-containing protein 3-like n=1 Tax=Sardina pilchardus TaxID=27697 RepID=UPI002E164E7C
MEECKSDDVSDQFTQGDLKHIFQVLEEKIITFVKNELKRFKKIVSPDYQEHFEDKKQDESDAREGALKMALHFLRNMKQKHIADKLKENEYDVVCQTELKRNLKKKYQSVFEGIQKQGSSALLEKIYTEVYITEGGSGKVNEEHEVRQIESMSKRPAGQETPIKCTDILKPLPGRDKPIRSVITKGVAGIGKTVSVQKYILDWAEGKENQDIHFIFPLPFRELNNMKDKQLSLMDLLHHFFSEIKQLTFPSQGKYKVLFIFDGLDECRLQLDFQKNEILTEVTKVTSLDVLLTNLIKDNLLRSALLWITSRPAATNQIPPECVDRVTEVQGFSDAQKEVYFRKRISDQNLASKVITHIESSRSLHIMCHIPVFCWIAATVLEFLLKTEGDKQVPKTLTEVYTYFLVFQTKQRSLKFEGVYDTDPQWNQASLLALGKLAYEQLNKGNLIFYEDDLRESGINVREAAVHCGICTQIFQEESGLHQEKLYCFVHLSIQEYLAALYVILMLVTEGKDLMSPQQPPRTMFQRLIWQTTGKSLTTLQKSAVDKALEHGDGRFDLFLRFLLGLSLESNQRLLRGLIKKVQHESKEEIASYIKTKIREMPSSERVLNLFHCLNEVNDHSLVEEVQSFLSAGTLSAAKLSPTQWSALVFVLLTSEEKLDVFDLKKYSRSDECLLRLQPVVEESQKALLSSCGLTERSCAGLASVLTKASSKLKHLDLSANCIGGIGVQELCSGLGNPNCALETLSLDNCSIGEEGFRALASALRANPSHMRELQLSENEAGDSGVKHLSSVLEDPNCKLEALQLNSCWLSERSCAALASALRSNPSHMRELQLSRNKAGDSGVKHLSSLLEDPNCKLEKLELNSCGLTERSCAALASALRSNPSHMRELQLGGNEAGDSGVKHLSSLLEDPNCKLEKLHLYDCSIGEEGCRALASALRSNPSHMRELQLSVNRAGDSGVKHLSSLLEDPNCKLEKLHLYDCSIGEEGCRALASALRSNPSHMRELQLSGNKAGDSGVKHLSSLLEDPNCQLEKLLLDYCSIGEEGFRALASALRSNPSHMRELQLGGNKAGDSGVKHLSSLLEDPNCQLEKLVLDNCCIGEEGFRALASALRSNPSHMRELQLSYNEAGDSGVKHLSSLLVDPNCKLEQLFLGNCSIGEEGFRALASALRSNPSHMRELQLSGNEAGDSGVKHLSSLLEDPNCKLEKLDLDDCSIGEEGFRALASALRSNPSHMRELQLSRNKAGDSGVKHLSSLLEDPNCKLEKLHLQDCSIRDEGFRALASALRSNPSALRELYLHFNYPGPSAQQLLSELKKHPNCKHLHILGP